MIDPLKHIQPSINIWTAIILFGIIQGVVLLAYVYKNKGLGHSYLSLLILTLVVAEIEAFLYYSGYIVHAIHWLYVSIPFILLCGVTLLAYIKRLNNEEVDRKFWIIHGWPIAACTIYTFLFYIQPTQKKLYNYLTGFGEIPNLPRPYQYFNPDPFEINGWIFVEGMAIYLLIYGLISWRKSSKINSSSLRRWAYVLTIIIIMIGSMMLLAEGGQIERMVLYEPVLPGYLTRVHASIALYILAIYALFHPAVLKSKPKYENSTLTKKLRVAQLKKIKTAYEQEKVHLDQNYSLTALSQSTGIAEHHISEVINLDLGLNFYELTNQYRISEAKEFLAQKDRPDWSMEQLAYEIGYKSKSTFYNAFKKELGVTPIQYQNTL